MKAVIRFGQGRHQGFLAALVADQDRRVEFSVAGQLDPQVQRAYPRVESARLIAVAAGAPLVTVLLVGGSNMLVAFELHKLL